MLPLELLLLISNLKSAMSTEELLCMYQTGFKGHLCMYQTGFKEHKNLKWKTDVWNRGRTLQTANPMKTSSWLRILHLMPLNIYGILSHTLQTQTTHSKVLRWWWWHGCRWVWLWCTLAHQTWGGSQPQRWPPTPDQTPQPWSSCADASICSSQPCTSQHHHHKASLHCNKLFTAWQSAVF